MTKPKPKDQLKKNQPPAKKAAPKKEAAELSGTAHKSTHATVTVEKSGPKPSPAQARKEAKVRVDLLDNWMGLNAEVKTMSEDEAESLIQHERENRCRPNVILRLHGRFNKLRGIREKSELMRPLA